MVDCYLLLKVFFFLVGVFHVHTHALSNFDGPLAVIWFETVKIFTRASSELLEVAFSIAMTIDTNCFCNLLQRKFQINSLLQQSYHCNNLILILLQFITMTNM